MEEKIAVWSTAIMVAAIVALLIFGSVKEFAEPEAIRDAAEKGAVFLALGLALSFFG